MISIKVNGQFLELYPSTKINLKLNSPIFADGNIIPGSYSIPFDIPLGKASEANSKILGHPDVIENAVCIDSYPAELYIDKILFKEGKLNFTEVSQNSITGNFVFGFQQLDEKVTDIRLQTILDEELIINDSSAFVREIYLRFTEPSRTYSIFINGSEYSVDVSAIDERAKYDNLAASINANSGSNNVIATVPLEISPPILILKPSNNPTDLNSEFKVIVDVLAFWDVNTNYETYFNSLSTNINPYLSLTKPDDKIRFPMFRNIGAYENNIHVNNHCNSNIDGEIITNQPQSFISSRGYRYMNFNSIVPLVKLQYVIDRISEYFGVSIIGTFLNTTYYTKGLIFNSKNIDLLVDFFNDIPIIFFKDSINLGDHVPKIKVNEFLKELQTRFNLSIYFNESINSIVINERNPILANKNYEDVTALSSTPKISDVTCTKGINLIYNNTTEDQEAIPDEILTGTEITFEIPTKTGGVYAESSTFNNQTIIQEFFTLPTVNEEPTSEHLRLVFETDDKLTDSENSSFSTFAREINSGFYFENIYDEIWDQYIRFLLNRKKATATVNFELRHLLAIDFEKKYRIAGINYLINSIDVTLTMQGIQPATVELFTT